MSVQNSHHPFMGRPREFDREEVLDKAVEVFWTRGFEATSMSDLVAELGIGRQSLYSTFGDKKQLFAEALDRYMSFNDARIKEMLGGDAGLEGVRAFVMSSAEDLGNCKARRACLMFNSIVELAPFDGEVDAQVKRGMRRVRQGFEGALKHAQARGTLKKDAEPKELALFLTMQIGGMAVLAKAGASKKELLAAAELALGTLTG